MFAIHELGNELIKSLANIQKNIKKKDNPFFIVSLFEHSEVAVAIDERVVFM